MRFQSNPKTTSLAQEAGFIKGAEIQEKTWISSKKKETVAGRPQGSGILNAGVKG